MIAGTLEKCDLNETDVLCVFGMAPEPVFEEVKGWLETGEKQLLFFQEGVDETVNLELLNHPKVRYITISFLDEDEQFCQVAWELVFLRFSYLAPENNARGKEIFEKLGHYQAGAHLVASDYRDLGVAVFRNVCANMPLLARAQKGEGLAGCFEKIPAIICGAGPSLSKNIAVLKELKDQALIFAGGSGLNALADSGVVPHFSASFDPEPPYRRFLEQVFFESPFFYQQRVSCDLLKLVHSPLLWIPANGNYPIEEWLEASAGLEAAPFDSGWTVPNLCVAAAAAMGCDPIIFVGMDLACAGETLYAPGIDQKMDFKEMVLAEDSEGNPVYSRRDWIMTAEWISEFAEKHPDIEFINATEGGLGFKGIPAQPLSSVDLPDSHDLRGKVHAFLQQGEKTEAGEERIEKVLQELKSSLERTEQKCGLLLAELEKIYPQPPHEKGECVLLEFELEEEVVYQRVLEPLWRIWKQAIQRHAKDPYQLYVQRLLFFKRILGEYLS